MKIISKKTLFVFLVTFQFSQVTLANPILDQIAAGQVQINKSNSTLYIKQGSQKAIINWRSFNIQGNEKTQFIQPDSSSIALNRINAAQGASKIYGALISNGKIILVNQAGIYFGPTARVDVGSIIATTTNITNENFLADKYIFDQVDPRYEHGSIINDGKITAANYGLVALIGNNVINRGVIQAKFGKVILATGEKFTFDFAGDELINFTVDSPASSGKIRNEGAIIADGGSVLLSANAANKILDDSINMSGVIQANSVAEKNGEIILSANEGTVKISGQIIAEGNQTGTRGGNVKVTGPNIIVDSHAKITTASDLGSGRISIGNRSSNVNIKSGAILNASASGTSALGGAIMIDGNNVNIGGYLTVSGLGENGSGGFISVYGNRIEMACRAALDARGSTSGGFIEVGNNTAFDVASLSINIEGGILTAAALGEGGSGGRITLTADNVNLQTNIDSSAVKPGSSGGSISIEGKNITLGSNNIINVFGNDLGGVVSIGKGNFYPTPTENLTIEKYSLITASSMNTGGNISLFAKNLEMNGQLQAKGYAPEGVGGTIEVTGEKIHLGSRSRVDVASGAGGGNIFIGGNSHGAGPLPNATDVTVDAGSFINASALVSGDGGNVVLWADNSMIFGGTVWAKGGYLGGNGGYVEINGKNNLNYNGNVDVSAPRGEPGTFILGDE